ncbi:DNA polymerase III subunit chi [Chitinivorax sp. PXF-14]|uniref:DNA polymerase III subunit chi n=1 Tax=Chitinivorax sp. PXF-14 TaxID=3230488 RepID=UPI003466CD6D
MTRIDFYTHVNDRLGIVCQLVAKAYGLGQKVVVFTAGPGQTAELDERLWTYAQLSFVPHCRSASALAGETPVIIDHEIKQFPHLDVLINLQAEPPPFFARFERLIEVVDTDPTVAAAARNRFRHYRDSGYAVQSHNLSHLGG